MKRLLLGGGASQAVSVLVLTFAARTLGPPEFGLAASIMAIGFIAGTFSNFGLNTHHIRQLSADYSLLRRLLGAFAGRVFSAFVMGSFAGLLGVALGHFDAWSALGSVLVAGGSQITQCMQVPLYARGAYWLVAVTNVVDKVAFGVTFAAVEIQGSTSANSLVWCFAAGNFVSAALAISLWRTHVQWRPLNFKFPRVRVLYRGSGWTGLSGLSFSAAQLDVVVARAVSPGAETGEYAAVSRWTQPLVMISAATAATVLRDASAATSNEAAYLAAVRRARTPFLAVAGLAVVLATAAFTFAGTILGPGYQNAAAPAALLVASTPFSFVNQIALNFLLARRQDRRAARWAVATVTAQLVAVPPLTLALGSTGPALAVLGMQISLSVLLSRECLVTRRSDTCGPTGSGSHAVNRGEP